MTSFHGILDALEDVAVAIEASELRVEEIVCIERQTDKWCNARKHLAEKGKLNEPYIEFSLRPKLHLHSNLCPNCVHIVSCPQIGCRVAANVI